MTESQHYIQQLLDLDIALEYAIREYQNAYFTAEEYSHKRSYQRRADNLWKAYQDLIKHTKQLLNNPFYTQFVDDELMPNIVKIQKEVF